MGCAVVGPVTSGGGLLQADNIANTASVQQRSGVNLETSGTVNGRGGMANLKHQCRHVETPGAVRFTAPENLC